MGTNKEIIKGRPGQERPAEQGRGYSFVFGGGGVVAG